jgi:hypothetical protein
VSISPGEVEGGGRREKEEGGGRREEGGGRRQREEDGVEHMLHLAQKAWNLLLM